MKRLFLFLGACSFASAAVVAQPVVKETNRAVKLLDVIADYKNSDHFALHNDNDKVDVKGAWDVMKAVKGEKDIDYRFNKWVWYWERHTDSKGYLVSPAKTYAEYMKYRQANSGRSTQRTTSSSPLTWTFQGPDSSGAFIADGAGSGVGRLSVVAFHPTDSNTFLVGSPGGGAWKTTNNGLSWTCLTDQLPDLSVSDLKYNPLNANTVYMCSGDRDGQDYFGMGLLKSYDGGATWMTTGMTWADSLMNIANSILVNPLDTNSLILGTTAGVYRSFDGGATWTLANAGNFTQLVYRPSDTATVYAGTLSSTSTSAQFYRSTDGGMTWTATTSLSSVDRVSVAVTVAAPNVVMLLTSNVTGSNPEGLSGIYKSSNKGGSFTELYTGSCTGNHDLLGWNADASDCGGQGWYDLPIAISPLDSNRVFIGGVNGWTSTNGGGTWNIMNQWTGMAGGVIVVHADKHFMGYNPLCPTRFFETNDGGIYSSYTPTATGTWQNLTNGLGITEFYSVAASSVANFVVAGAQDVGSKLVRPGLFEEADGGDGMACQLDFVDSTVAYTSSDGGFLDIINPTAAQPDLTAVDISANIPGSVEGTGAWVTPYVLEPSCHTCVLTGYQMVYRSCDQGNSWNAISPALSSGGNNLEKVVPSEADSNTVYATEDGSGTPVHVTHNMGGSWSSITVPYSSKYITDLKVDPRNQNQFWVSFAGYGANHVAQYNPTSGWQTFDAGLPDVPVHCLAMNKITREMYAGTDIGVFYRDSTMTSWVMNSAGMPAVRVTDLEFDYGAGVLWAATYGRSLWKALLPTEVSTVPFTTHSVKVAPNPNNGTFTIALNNIADKNVDIRVVDIAGRMAWQQSNVQNTGAPISLTLGNLPMGTYIVEVAVNGAIAAKEKMVVVKQ